MSDEHAIFRVFSGSTNPEDTVRQAITVVETFTSHFNNQNIAGMDALLHFPHIILAGESLVLWEAPGQVTQAFFDELKALGWARSEYLEKRPVLVGENKVHLLVTYTRSREDGSVITRHENLWIITRQDGRWGIKQRSY